ncbi:peptidoglycan DD-metalloendopeptidase family protein [Spirilliplanes yamanashiensis]|uniref:M23ase beta-sheet core domain-containing protein n=1 Tax=Spirilliplanes yamanashiensis TaxID=42233 RepID=A0A8J4DGG4_9ACTN|nr:peptidoglycan DD-metalloendopeptidase family protein [Spirilliplanes yamanashiensis]MDP9814359.1 murein DD-endopeptidase MepM/ murein hydrolase activator NlpD [Spirilliplanes yamanashiensis]GIJ00658.1 hypothetical protein Sya03_00100 [Spirilliplanes yamanashiensis]
MRGRTVLVGLAVAATAAAALLVTAPGASAGDAATGVVDTRGIVLNARGGPSPDAEKRGAIPHGRTVTIVCQQPGATVTGTVRRTDLWNRLPDGSYVSDAYVERGAAALPVCDAPAARPPAEPAPAWVPPVAARLGSTFRSAHRPAHDGIDFPARKGTPVRAASGGTVIRVACQSGTGTCDADGFIGAGGCGWYAEIQHAGAVVTRYCHLVRRPPVAVGQAVTAGQTIGHVGSSGNSSGPHLHFEVHRDAAPATDANAVNPVPFLQARGVALSGR